MSIRLVNGCGLPTSIKDGVLCIHGYDNKIVASITLPFNTKFNGELNAELIKYPNVLLITPADDGVLVMRYDGTYTLYTMDMRPKGFGKYDTNIIYSQVTIDRLGSFEEVPFGFKKPRLYAAFFIRYRDSKAMHYTCIEHPVIKEIASLADEEVVNILNEGLNVGTEGWPKFTPVQDCLFFEGRVIIPCNDVYATVPVLQNNILYSCENNDDAFFTMYRRKPYAEVVCELQEKFTVPAFMKEMLDIEYLAKPDRAKVDRRKSEVAYQMACMMSKHQDYILACELDGYVCYCVDDMGKVFYHQIFDLSLGTMDLEGTQECILSSASSKHSLCGYVNSRVMEISIPTIIPRLPYRSGSIFVAGKEILVKPDVSVARVPDSKMSGFRECVTNKQNCVLYHEDYTYEFM